MADRRTLLAALGLCLAPALALAQAPAAAPCGHADWSIERERAAFAGTVPSLPSGAALPGLGQAAVVTLVPNADLVLPVPPARPGKPDTFGGYITLAAPAEAGTYQVTVSEEAWIDVSQDGRTSLKAAAFSGKIGCPGIHKSVRFVLGAAPVTVEVSRVPKALITVGIFKAE